jgi:hypothetical protein
LRSKKGGYCYPRLKIALTNVYFYVHLYSMKKTVCTLLFITIALVACEDKFDIKASWKEVMVVYGLLDQSQPIQYVKISKAFLGDGDANVMAQNADSTNYNPADLDVKLQRMVNGAQVGPDIALTDTDMTGKKSGVFSSSPNIIYKTSEHLYTDSKYKLIVKNKKTGNEASAITPLIGEFSVNLLSPTVGFVLTADPVEYSTMKVRWTSVANAKLYQVNIRFNYSESDGQTVTQKHIDWLFASQKIEKVKEGVEMEQEVSGQNFYQLLNSRKNEDFANNNVSRTAGTLDFTITCGGEELATYIEVTKPSSNINQEKPFYTNVTNGIGIFSCRYVSNVVSKTLSANSLLELKSGELTKSFNFQ